MYLIGKKLCCVVFVNTFKCIQMFCPYMQDKYTKCSIVISKLKTTNLKCMFITLFYVPFENISLTWKRHILSIFVENHS